MSNVIGRYRSAVHRLPFLQTRDIKMHKIFAMTALAIIVVLAIAQFAPPVFLDAQQADLIHRGHPGNS